MYEIRITPSAYRQLKKLPDFVKDRIVDKVFLLEKDPKPQNSKKLSGWTSLYRLRIGDYRVIYEVHNSQKSVVILKCMHRREIYR